MARTIIRAAWVAAILATALGGWYFFDPRYYTAAQLDQRPYPLRRIDLEPSEPGARLEFYGRLKMNVFIGARGGVDRVEVVSSMAPDAFRDRVVLAFREARWEPGRKWGRAVRSVKTVEINFPPPSQSLDRAISPPDQ